MPVWQNCSYINAGTILPNWHDLVIHSAVVATDKDFEIAQNWSSDLPPMVLECGYPPNSGLNRITDPFVVVSDQPTATYNNNAPSHSSISINTECEVPAKLSGLNGKSTSSMPTCSDSVDSASKARKLTSQDSAQTNVRWYIGSTKPTDSDNEVLHMPN